MNLAEQADYHYEPDTPEVKQDPGCCLLLLLAWLAALVGFMFFMVGRLSR